MPVEGTSGTENEVAALIERLRAEARASGVPEQGQETAAALGPLSTRREAEELWAVTSDRVFLSKPGTWGRVRGALLAPVKVVLKKLMRWYVEPPFSDQRRFNVAVLLLVDEAHARMSTAIAQLEARVSRLEQGQSRDSEPR
jgi:hypothetical protein